MPPGHDMTIAAIGGVILWFGWYGFNPGSTLSAMDFERHRPGRGQHDAGRVRRRSGRDVLRVSHASRSGTRASPSTASSAGLVAITCPCYWVSRSGRSCIGAVAGVVVVLGVDFIEWLRVDDPIGAVAVHGFVRHLGHAQPRPVRHRSVRRAGPDRRRHVDAGHGPVLRRWAETSWSRRSSAAPSVTVVAFAVGLVADVRRQGDRHAAGLRGRRARGHRHPRARRARLPPRVRLHGGVVQRRLPCRAPSAAMSSAPGRGVGQMSVIEAGAGDRHTVLARR